METNEKKSLFTAVSEEQSATVCGGDGLPPAVQKLLNGANTITVNNDPSTTVDSTGNLTAFIGGLNIKIGLFSFILG